MTAKNKREIERCVDDFLSLCEKLLLRTAIFGCIVYELSRFARWLLM